MEEKLRKLGTAGLLKKPPDSGIFILSVVGANFKHGG